MALNFLIITAHLILITVRTKSEPNSIMLKNTLLAVKLSPMIFKVAEIASITIYRKEKTMSNPDKTNEKLLKTTTKETNVSSVTEIQKIKSAVCLLQVNFYIKFGVGLT